MRTSGPVKRRIFLSAAAAAPAAVTFLVPGVASARSLQDAVARAASASSGDVAVYARRIGSAVPAVALNAEVQYPAASIIKLLIFVTLYQEVDRRPGLLEAKIAVKREDFVGGSDVLQNANPGDTFSLDTVSRAMIDQSDNTASNMLISYFGVERLNATARRIGLPNTQIKRHFMDQLAIGQHIQNLTSARDMGVLLYLIERGSREGVFTIASPKSCRAMIDVLLKQEDRDKIARGLPKGTPLANKTGEIDGVRNDVGIVDPLGDSPYVLAVLTKDLNDFSIGNHAIRVIAKAVHAAIGGGSAAAGPV